MFHLKYSILSPRAGNRGCLKMKKFQKQKCPRRCRAENKAQPFCDLGFFNRLHKIKPFFLTLTLVLLCGCVNAAASSASISSESVSTVTEPFTRTSLIRSVMNDPAFGNFGRLLFPTDSTYYSGSTLEQLKLTYYTHIDPDETVDIVNTLRDRAQEGQTIFYDIYTEQEKAQDPAKRDTGLFYFKGKPGAKFAVCNAGGAFAYVGAMQDSFPHALELSKKGYNAFALIYRPGAQTACEDLARAIQFIFQNAEELEVDTDCYSLWGGSAGARMAAWLGTYGPKAFGGGDLPRPGAVIMQYTGLGEYSESDPPTYACVGDQDGIANWRIMQARLNAMQQAGIDTEFHCYPGLGHGFGLGTGTSADGWLNDAVAFWEKQMA